MVCLCHFLVMFNPAAVAAERAYCEWRDGNSNNQKKKEKFSPPRRQHNNTDNDTNVTGASVQQHDDATAQGMRQYNPGWPARICLRTLLVAFCFLIASTIPNFGKLVDLVGSGLVMLLQIIFPVVFYICLRVGPSGAVRLGR